MSEAIDLLEQHLRWLGEAGAIGILTREDAQAALREVRSLRGSHTLEHWRASCQAQAATIREQDAALERLADEIREQDAETQRLRAEIARLTAPVTDEALIEAAAAVIHDAMEDGEMDARYIARAVLAAVSEPLRAAERERCASLEDAVRTYLAANGSGCACGNGHVPVTAYQDACAAYAAAIRRDTNAG